MNTTGAQLLVECLKNEGVKYVFGIPGAKIDAVFNSLADGGPELILCRHEQNAAFMAACIGRLTGSPGVVVVTSGPGVCNLTTGLATATTEGDPVVAFGGAVPRSMQLKATHQSLDNVSVMKPVTKSSVEVVVPESIPEVVQNAFRLASRSRGGATFVSLPQDVMGETTDASAWKPIEDSRPGAASAESLKRAIELINKAKEPVLFLGLEASRPGNAKAIRAFLASHPMATVMSYEAAGTISRDLEHLFGGRVGLFKNQPGDRLLETADLVVTVGFDPVEYDPSTWNSENALTIVHIDEVASQIDRCYRPAVELLGDIAATFEALSEQLKPWSEVPRADTLRNVRADLEADLKRGAKLDGSPIHPLRFIHDLRAELDDETTVVCDIGSHYMWMARHFYSYEPRHLLFSNGQQTLGVALPWAMAASLVRPEKKVVSISGDGGFLFSAMELENAVRIGSNFVHFVWRDGSYDMVGSQERMKYGREFGVRFGSVDLIKFAESFGATGFAIEHADEIIPTLRKAMEISGPVLIDVPIDYSENDALFATVHSDRVH